MPDRGQRGQEHGEEATVSAVDALTSGARRLVEGGSADAAIEELLEAAARATRSDVAVVRSLDTSGLFVARAVSASSPAVVAELEGSRLPAADAPNTEVDDPGAVSASLHRLAERLGADGVLQVPVLGPDGVTGTLELLRQGQAYGEAERALARLAAGQLAIAFRNGKDVNGDLRSEHVLRIVGDALAAGSDETRTADQVAVLAAEVAGAEACLVWLSDGGTPALAASHGLVPGPGGLRAAAEAAGRALEALRPLTLDEKLGDGDRATATLQLGQPPFGALQLIFAPGATPPEHVLDTLATFGGRAAHALRAGERARRQSAELERTRALLGAVAQAIAQLSLAHTLETSIDRVSDLLETDRLAVYLQEADDEQLLAAAGRGLAGPHVAVAERLLQIALVGMRATLLVVDDAARDLRLSGVRESVAEAGIEAALAVPLLAHDEVIGILAAYPERGREVAPETASLVEALAAQLAVAVQNARLHERAKRAVEEKEQALEAERTAARRLRALYEISGSFAQSMSLEATLEAAARTVVEVLEVDAAAIAMPSGRGDELVTRALHVRDEQLDAPLRSILARPQRLASLAPRRPFRTREPLLLDPAVARELGGLHALLVPFLEKGSTVAIIPVSTQAEAVGALTVVSLDPARPIDEETVETALTIAGHAALALDNARLYQQQKEFTEAMQRSLLPDTRPEVEGLEVGEVYASSARVDVGGDVYDFLTLDDGRLAVVLGDVTGHGVDAAADMAMAKFVFRSLAREHPAPGEFLAAANEVVVGEIATSKFVTMLYLTIDPATGEVACASAGHPPPRVLASKGGVVPIPATGLALGIDGGQVYDEVRAELAPGAAVVVFTDGVIEARRDGEMYGVERLDRVLEANIELSPERLAQAVVADAREFGGGDLADDCAVVVIRRVA